MIKSKKWKGMKKANRLSWNWRMQRTSNANDCVFDDYYSGKWIFCGWLFVRNLGYMPSSLVFIQFVDLVSYCAADTVSDNKAMRLIICFSCLNLSLTFQVIIFVFFFYSTHTKQKSFQLERGIVFWYSALALEMFAITLFSIIHYGNAFSPDGSRIQDAMRNVRSAFRWRATHWSIVWSTKPATIATTAQPSRTEQIDAILTPCALSFGYKCRVSLPLFCCCFGSFSIFAVVVSFITTAVFPIWTQFT